MPSTKVDVYEFDRRQLLQAVGSLGVASAVLSPAELFASGLCEKIGEHNDSNGAIVSGRRLQYWIDGLHLVSGESNVRSRANVALFMNLKQLSSSYVESVVLMDSQKRTIGARYFEQSQKMEGGFVPYVMFENVALDSTKDYHVLYSVREGTKSIIYTAIISKPQQSRLNSEFLPISFQRDFNKFFVTGDNPTPGLITNPFQYYTKNGLATHCARGKIVDVSSNGQFKINIEFMHGDGGADHFMRYFVVMDPVGRLLGFHKRSFGDGISGSVDVSRLTDKQIAQLACDDGQADADEAKKDKVAKCMSDLELKPDLIAQMRLDLYADIRDCTHLQIYTEDVYDALARTVIRLR
jgi:hypothetical protein